MQTDTHTEADISQARFLNDQVSCNSRGAGLQYREAGVERRLMGDKVQTAPSLRTSATDVSSALHL